MARRRDPDREGYWRGILADQRTSGLSIAAFCRRRQISEASFFNWRRRLARPAAPNDFVAVNVALPQLAPCSCEVTLPNGCRVTVPPGFDPVSLKEILAALSQWSGESC